MDDNFDNAKTIRPGKSPYQPPSPLPSVDSPRSQASDIEDYSDLAGDEEELHLKARVADFKVNRIPCLWSKSSLTSSCQAKNAAKASLYHPDDIKFVGLAQSRSRSGPGGFVLGSSSGSPTSTPSGSLASRPRPVRPGLSPVGAASSGGHSRSLSLGSGSVGAAEAQRLLAQSELGRYVEDEEDDYEDIFAASTDSGNYRPPIVPSGETSDLLQI